MTTYEGVPSFGTFLTMKLANQIAKAKSRQRMGSTTTNRVRTWVQTTVRLVAHLAGFSLLTWAGFTWNMTAGLIVAGISCFVFAWLLGGSSTEIDSDARHNTYDPMASRR